jgi:FKBP12-rapamycin complex-associated protein
LSEDSMARVLSCYSDAIRYDEKSYKAWHAWAMMNVAAVKSMSDISVNTTAEPSSEPWATSHSLCREPSWNLVLDHVMSALRGFFLSITLGGGHMEEGSLQDLLRLLTLWFRYGGEAKIDEVLNEGFALVHIDTWLHVLPQIIARVHAPEPRVRSAVQRLLLSVGRVHPQALIYPVAVASQEARSRNRASSASASPDTGVFLAENILTLMRSHSDVLVEQTLLVSNELIRVSILWAEQWHEALEQAYRRYFFQGEAGADGAIAALQPLYAKLEAGAETENELAFVEAYANDLRNGMLYCNEFALRG